MSGLTLFFIGLLIGWVLEWFIDRYFWRATEEEIQSAEDCQADKQQMQAELDAAMAQVRDLQAQVEDAEAKIDELELAVEEATTKLAVHELEKEDEAEAADEAAEEETAEPEVVEPDDLTAIEGVGPKIDGILKAAGIQTFTQLAQADVENLRTILEEAGSRYKLAVPDTWPEQAALAAKGDWDALEALQDALSGGRRADEAEESE